MKEHRRVEGIRTSPKEDDKLSSRKENESTILTSAGAGAAMEEQELKSDKFL